MDSDLKKMEKKGKWKVAVLINGNQNLKIGKMAPLT
jgi:hypothetical protein